MPGPSVAARWARPAVSLALNLAYPAATHRAGPMSSRSCRKTRRVKLKSPTGSPSCPRPMTCPPRTVSGYDHVFTYYDRDGRLLRYVVRNDTKPGKDRYIRPLTYRIL